MGHFHLCTGMLMAAEFVKAAGDTALFDEYHGNEPKRHERKTLSSK